MLDIRVEFRFSGQIECKGELTYEKTINFIVKSKFKSKISLANLSLALACLKNIQTQNPLKNIIVF